MNASEEAFVFGVPDGTTGVAGYAAALFLAAAGGSRETGRHPPIDVLMGGVVSVGAAAGAYYLYEMAFHQKRVCPYCVTGAALHFAMIGFALPEVRDAIAELRRAQRTSR